MTYCSLIRSKRLRLVLFDDIKRRKSSPFLWLLYQKRNAWRCLMKNLILSNYALSTAVRVLSIGMKICTLHVQIYSIDKRENDDWKDYLLTADFITCSRMLSAPLPAAEMDFRDFKLTVDPVYGNCYTFNAYASRNFSSTRYGAPNGNCQQFSTGCITVLRLGKYKPRLLSQ